MHGLDFAHKLASWIPPGVIAEAALELYETPRLSSEICTLTVTSALLRSGTEAGLNGLVDAYLENFHLPHELVELASSLYNSHFHESAKQLILDTRFSGEVSYEPGPHSGPSGVNAIMRLRLPALQLRLVRWPIVMLTDTVTHLARFWQKLATSELPESIHHEHLADRPLLAWIDLHVARYYGFRLVGKAGMTSDHYQIESVGRFRSVHGALPVESGTLAALELAQALLARRTARNVDFYRENDADA